MKEYENQDLRSIMQENLQTRHTAHLLFIFNLFLHIFILLSIPYLYCPFHIYTFIYVNCMVYLRVALFVCCLLANKVLSDFCNETQFIKSGHVHVVWTLVALGKRT